MIAGVDEAGRGCLFGRVYAAAVVWNPEIDHKHLKDSKRLSAKNRDNMYQFIIDEAIDYGIGYAESHEIDSENILQATLIAMHRALRALTLSLDRIHVDGTQFKIFHDENSNKISHETFIGGDNLYKHIMAASILAKVSQDRWIAEKIKDPKYSMYSMETGMGYGTQKHIDALREYGPSDQHRLTFLRKMQIPRSIVHETH